MYGLKKVIIMQNENYIDYIEDEEETNLERFLKRQLNGEIFCNFFEDLRHENSLMFLVSITDPDMLKQTRFLDHKKSI